MGVPLDRRPLCGRARPSLSFLSPFPPSRRCARLRQPAAHLREGGKGERKIGFVAQDYGLAGPPDSLSKSLLPFNTNIKSIRLQGAARARAQTPAQKCNPIGRIKYKKLDPEVVESARRMRHEAAAPRKCPAPGALTRPPAPPRGPQRIVDSTAAAAADSTAAAPRSQPPLPASVRERRASNAT